MQRGRPSKKKTIECEKCQRKFKDERYLKQHICTELKSKPTDLKLCWYCGEEIQKHNFKRHETTCAKRKFLEVTIPLMSLFCRIINLYNKELRKTNYLLDKQKQKKIIYELFKDKNKEELTEKKIEEEFQSLFNLQKSNLEKKEKEKELEELKKKANAIKIEKKHKELFNEEEDSEEDKKLEEILKKIEEKDDEEAKSVISYTSDEDEEKKYLKIVHEQQEIKKEINKINLTKNKSLINLKLNEKENEKLNEEKNKIKEIFGFIPEDKYIKIFIEAKNWYIPGISAREIIKKYYIEQNINYNEISKTIEKKFEKKDYPTSDEIYNISPNLFKKIKKLRDNSNYNEYYENFFYLFKNLNENQINFQCPLCDKIIKQKRPHMLNCPKFQTIFSENKKEAIEYFMTYFYPLQNKEPYLLYYENKDYNYFKDHIIADIHRDKIFQKKRIEESKKIENKNKLLGKKTKRLTKKELLKEILDSIDN